MTETHEARESESKAYHEKQQKRRGRPPKAPINLETKSEPPIKGQQPIVAETEEDQEVWYVRNGHKVIQKIKVQSGNVHSNYVGDARRIPKEELDKLNFKAA